MTLPADETYNSAYVGAAAAKAATAVVKIDPTTGIPYVQTPGP